ncbi:salicyloyl-CoA 5-hydroxylase [Chloroflexota bacterium]|nr:salicyloyl-CoA 5-hydroxylase [Chloroflexota bacterium]
MPDDDILPSLGAGDYPGMAQCIILLQKLKGTPRKYNAPPKGVLRSVTLKYCYHVRRVSLHHQYGEVETGRPTTQNINLHSINALLTNCPKSGTIISHHPVLLSWGGFAHSSLHQLLQARHNSRGIRVQPFQQ